MLMKVLRIEIYFFIYYKKFLKKYIFQSGELSSTYINILIIYKISEFSGFIFKFLSFRLGTSSLHQKVGLFEFSRSC